jgi:hypothetical protein
MSFMKSISENVPYLPVAVERGCERPRTINQLSEVDSCMAFDPRHCYFSLKETVCA